GWRGLDKGVAGSGFFVPDRVEGESVGRRVVREPALEPGRRALPAQMGQQLARIHALSFEGLDFLPRPGPGQSPARRALARTAAPPGAPRAPPPAPALGLPPPA